MRRPKICPGTPHKKRRQRIFPTVYNLRLYRAIERLGLRHWREVMITDGTTMQWLDAVVVINGELVVLELVGNYGYSGPARREREIIAWKKRFLHKRGVKVYWLRRNNTTAEHEFEILKIMRGII
jgi:hypothetical protein